ncbi:hypothetical protein COU57_03080 [Candidatus Pacearchaeota archaeon CG10_big_fil_rev_8_21_14_0_10_32_14]|nr:MAG: hypothetical protein COU57_03080 [Candidatus Pacearchaeota archaeon CG10_big_fil_rev_8_21_14_0_10_32_14]
MKKRYILLVVVIILVGLYFFYLYFNSNNINNCKKLAERLDNEAVSKISLGKRCDDWEDKQLPLYVGGYLENMTRTKDYDYYTYTLVFKGIKNRLIILIETKEDSIPYNTGKFYKFNLNGQCRLSYLSTFSGKFYDPYLNKLKPLDC